MTPDLLLPLDEAGPADRRSLDARAVETECDLAWSLYCEMATRCQLPVPEERSAARLKLLKKRLADHGGLDRFRYALETIERSRELRGESARRWKVHIDYVLQPARYIQLLERVFDQDWGKVKAAASAPVGRSALDAYRHATSDEMEMQRLLFNGNASGTITQRQADWYRHQDGLRRAGHKARWKRVAPQGWTKKDDEA